MKRFKDLFEEKSKTDIIKEMKATIEKLRAQLDTTDDREMLELKIDALQRELFEFMEL